MLKIIIFFFIFALTSLAQAFPSKKAIVKVVSITRGSGFTCILTNDGLVRCFGQNGEGQLGQNSNSFSIGSLPSETPENLLPIDFPAKVVQISSGQQHSCALLETGKIRCWGNNLFYQLGYNHNENVGTGGRYNNVCSGSTCSKEWIPGISTMAAGDVPLPLNAIKVVAGFSHTCAILSDTSLRCWGSGDSGKLGTNSTLTRKASESMAVPLGSGVVDVALGWAHTCALLNNGKVRCWGNYMAVGRDTYVNIGSGERGSIPISNAGDVSLGANAIKIAAGASHTCAVLINGNLKCWGYNYYGQLGLGHRNNVGYSDGSWNTISMASAGYVNLGEAAKNVSVAYSNTCVTLHNDKIKCWGYGKGGQNGNGIKDVLGDNEEPISIPYIPMSGNIIGLSPSAAGGGFCAVFDDGAFNCWGTGYYGDNGRGNTSNIGDDEQPSSLPNIEIHNSPTASFTASAISGQAPLSISFDGSSSMPSDPSGSITSYLWDFGDNTTATGPIVDKNFTKGGKFLVTLTVTENTGRKNKRKLEINLFGNELIVLSEQSVNFFKGQAPYRLLAQSFEFDGSLANNNFVWESSDSTVVTVNSSGVINGLKAGIAFVKAKLGSRESVPVKVTVKEKTQGIQLNLPENYFASSYSESISGWIGSTKVPITVSSVSSTSKATMQTSGSSKGLFHLPVELLPGLNPVTFTAKGSSGYSSTLTQGIRYFDGVKSALYFEPNDTATITFRNTYNPISQSFTISFWLRSFVEDSTILEAIDVTGQNVWKFERMGNFLYFKIQTFSGEVVVADFAAPKDKWSHVAVTLTNGQLSIFNNGFLKGTRTVNDVNVLTPDSKIKLGNNSFAGIIDEFRYMRSPLTESQIRGSMFNEVANVGTGFAFTFNRGRTQTIRSDYNPDVNLVRGADTRVEFDDPSFRFAAAVVAQEYVTKAEETIFSESDKFRALGIPEVSSFSLIVPENSANMEGNVSVIMADNQNYNPSYPPLKYASPYIRVFPPIFKTNNTAMDFRLELTGNTSNLGVLGLVSPTSYYISPKEESNGFISWKADTSTIPFILAEDIKDENVVVNYPDYVEPYPSQSTFYSYFRFNANVTGTGPYSVTLSGQINSPFFPISLVCNNRSLYVDSFPLWLTGLSLGRNNCNVYYGFYSSSEQTPYKFIYHIHSFDIYLKKI